MDIFEAMSHEIDSFNSLQEHAGRSMRLKYRYNTKCAGAPGVLVIGSEAQLNVDVHQAELVDDVEAAYIVARALRTYYCAEFGE